jgi:uncharacterized membrane protein (UPF0127 family)
VIFVMKRVVLLAVVALAALAPAGCTRVKAAAIGTSRPVPNPSLNWPQGNLTVARSGTPELSLHVQIAETDQARQTGLMGVKAMSDQVGMAFLFNLSTSTPFWMKDTLIPLDIAFWDGQGRIVNIITMTPCKADPCYQYQPSTPYIASVEVNAGLLAAKGIHPGDAVTLTR